MNPAGEQMNPAVERMNELGFYGLPGAPKSPRDLIDECRNGEALGLGTVFLSERFNIKEVVTLAGVAGAVTEQMGIATGVTNHNTRHPIVTASFATTMHRLTEGRFALGLGRGIERLFDAFGMPRITTAQMEDFAGLMRRLWRGEVVFGHDGPAACRPSGQTALVQPAVRRLPSRGRQARFISARRGWAVPDRRSAVTRTCSQTATTASGALA